MTPHTAYPVCDFSYKRCCVNLMTKARSRFARWCRARGSASRGSPPTEPLPFGLRSLPASSGRQLFTRAEYVPLALAGNAVRHLTAHRDQRTIRLVSPNQLLKHYTGDYGCGAYTGSENIQQPAARKATVAAREHSKIALQGTKDTWFLLSCCLEAPSQPSPRLLRAVGTGRRVRVHLTAQCHCLWEQPPAEFLREAEKPVVSAGFPSWDHCVMKKHQQNQGGEQNQKDQSEQCKIWNALCCYHWIRLLNVKCIFTGCVYIPGHLLMQLFSPREKDRSLLCIFLKVPWQ